MNQKHIVHHSDSGLSLCDSLSIEDSHNPQKDDVQAAAEIVRQSEGHAVLLIALFLLVGSHITGPQKRTEHHFHISLEYILIQYKAGSIGNNNYSALRQLVATYEIPHGFVRSILFGDNPMC